MLIQYLINTWPPVVKSIRPDTKQSTSVHCQVLPVIKMPQPLQAVAFVF